MALTPERIMELSDRLLRVVGAGYVRPQDAEEFARAIESEARKQDYALILQLVDALENSSDLVFKDTTKADARDLAITAGRAWLESKP